MAHTDHLLCESYPYVTPEEVLTCCTGAAEQLTEDDPRLLDAVEDASFIVYYLTGKQFNGICSTTVRPCIQCDGCDFISGCRCNCCTPWEIDLNLWPLLSITSVRMDGETLTGSAITDMFHIDDYRYIVRNDGEPFPACNNMYAITGSEQDGLNDQYVFEFTVEYGMETPRLLTRATRALACNLLKQCLGLECQLPINATSISRRGVTYETENVIDYLATGRTGIYEVDLVVRTLNPNGLQSPSFAWSPGLHNSGRRVNTDGSIVS